MWLQRLYVSFQQESLKPRTFHKKGNFCGLAINRIQGSNNYYNCRGGFS
jgi:hypothetical protein